VGLFGCQHLVKHLHTSKCSTPAATPSLCTDLSTAAVHNALPNAHFLTRRAREACGKRTRALRGPCSSRGRAQSLILMFALLRS
jgi:hypothetical protein